MQNIANHTPKREKISPQVGGASRPGDSGPLSALLVHRRLFPRRRRDFFCVSVCDLLYFASNYTYICLPQNEGKAKTNISENIIE